jgi:hypothetical protein
MKFGLLTLRHIRKKRKAAAFSCQYKYYTVLMGDVPRRKCLSRAFRNEAIRAEIWEESMEK